MKLITSFEVHGFFRNPSKFISVLDSFNDLNYDGPIVRLTAPNQASCVAALSCGDGGGTSCKAFHYEEFGTVDPTVPAGLDTNNGASCPRERPRERPQHHGASCPRERPRERFFV